MSAKINDIESPVPIGKELPVALIVFGLKDNQERLVFRIGRCLLRLQEARPT